MPTKRLLQYLEDSGVHYYTLTHAPTVTAQETAAVAHVPGREVAKTVIVWMDGEMAMAVLPAARHIALDLFADLTGARSVELATEREFREVFPGCEVGAMPPFGNLYDMAVFVDEELAEDEEIVFNSGSHTELIRLSYADFDRLVEPVVLSFGALV